MAVVVYLLLAAVTLFYFWIKKRYQYWSDRGFLSPKPEIPFGSFKGVGSKLSWFEAIDNVYKEFKGKAPVVGFFIFTGPNILVIDPELIKNILVRDFNSFHDRGLYYNKKDDPLSAHLLSLEGQEWKERRTHLSPIFTSSKIKMMFEIVDSIADKLVKIFDTKSADLGQFEMKEWTARFTSDVIGNVAFGLECKCLEDENSEFFKYGKRISELTKLEILMFFFAAVMPNFCRKFGISTLPRESTEFFKNGFLQTIEYREKNKIERNDFVSHLLGLRHVLSPLELAGESFITFLGGYDTSSTLITFSCYELALNTEIQDRLRNELSAGLDENEGKFTYEMLQGCKYLNMVVNESLRKYPPIPGAFRVCTKEYTIPGTSLTIPKGAQVKIPTFSLHRDPEYYPEPEKFDPERFNDENSKFRNPFTFLPFAEGPRNCIGMRFGLMQSKLAIAKLVTNFEILMTEKTPTQVKFSPSSFVNPLGGMWLKLDKIQKKL